MGIISSNPNASTSAVSGIGAGSLLVWGLSKIGVSIDPVEAAAIAGALGAVVLFVGRNGLRGSVRAIWRGKDGPPPAPTPGGNP